MKSDGCCESGCGWGESGCGWGGAEYGWGGVLRRASKKSKSDGCCESGFGLFKSLRRSSKNWYSDG